MTLRLIFSITFYLIIQAPILKAQVALHELVSFKSPFEKQVFLQDSIASDLELLLAISPTAERSLVNKIEAEFSAFLQDLEVKKFSTKPDEKKVKLLFDLTHKRFFTKYQDISNFDLIFTKNQYNCVSASALYALLLKRLAIPFLIKEEPTHVYVVVYPETKSILLESTSPKTGFYRPTPTEVQKVVNSLVELKLYTKNEVDMRGVNEIYNDYFFSKEDISVKQLAGIQYANEAVQFMQNEEYLEALNSSLKAYWLYPSNNHRYLTFVLLANQLNKSKFTNQDEFKYLTYYSNLKMAPHDEIKQKWNSIIYHNLIEKSDVNFIDSAFNFLNKNISDSVLLRQLQFEYYDALGRFYGQRSEFTKAFENFDKAYWINPLNANTQGLLTSCIVELYGGRSGGVAVIKKLDDFTAKYDFLKSNNLMQSLYFFHYASIAYTHFRADDFSIGHDYLRRMEELYAIHGQNLKMDDTLHALVYAEAGAAYFRKRNYHRAKAIILKGLEVLPDDPELKVRLQIVIDEMKP